jgi:hypothetical protein
MYKAPSGSWTSRYVVRCGIRCIWSGKARNVNVPALNPHTYQKEYDSKHIGKNARTDGMQAILAQSTKGTVLGPA